MRLFFALELSPAVAEALHAATAPLRELEPALGWVAVNKLHLTMKFLGEVDESGAARLITAADAAVRAHRPFPMELGGIGAFPNFRRPRLVWGGVDPDARLELLHHDLETACERQGYELEGRAFRPHVTLARVRTPLAPDRARGFARAARAVAFSATELVERLTLFESTLAPKGAGYRRVHAAPLEVGGR